MFKHLKKLEVAGATSWIDMPELGPEARLQLMHAGQTNPAYYNALLKRTGRRARTVVGANDISVKEIDLNRRDDRDLYPGTVIVGWENVLGENGQPVPYSKEMAVALCQALPDWLFDRVRVHAGQPERFLSEPLPDAQELAGNSEAASAGN